MSGAKIVHIIISPTPWNLDNVKYRRHRLADFLANQKETERILWVYPVSATPRKPVSYIQAHKRLKKGFIQADRKVTLCGFPDLIPGRFQRVSACLLGHHIKKLKQEIENCEGKKVLWFTYPGFPYLLTMTGWDMTVYDCSDLWAAQESEKETLFSRLSKHNLKNAEEKIINGSGLIFATSDYLAETIRKYSGREAVVVENGVDYALFENVAFSGDKDILADISRPRLGFVGGMKPKIDFSLLASLADYNSGWSIVLIGPAPFSKNREFQELVSRRNVHWLGAIAPNEVPQYLQCLDVGLLPYREIEYNKAVFPLKLYEYLAAGLPVVGCNLPSTVKYGQDMIYLHTDTREFIGACQEALSWEKNEDIIKKRTQLAQEADWTIKLQYIYGKVLPGIEQDRNY